MGVSTPAVISTRKISKHYGNVVALSEVDFSIRKGEIVGLVGDNGAGKSTLVKILSGAVEPSSGHVLIEDRPVSLRSPMDSRRLGIETVYQDLALALQLSVAANVFLGREQRVRDPRGRLGWLDNKSMDRRAEEELLALRITLPTVSEPCESLSGGQRQAVAVARAASWGTRVVLMDEPTAALGAAQQGQVVQLVMRIRDRGIPVLLVSHNLPQIHHLCDRIVVLRLGRVVANLARNDVSIEDIVMWITGAASAEIDPQGQNEQPISLESQLRQSAVDPLP